MRRGQDMDQDYTKETDAGMLERIAQTIREHQLLNEKDYVVLGLSGGPDSLCLFDLLMRMRDELQLEIEVVHVNHMLRPGDADKDQEFVESVCADRGVKCRVIREDCAAFARENEMGVEEAGREIRYRAFVQAAQEAVEGGRANDKVRIAVAQNLNDQAETMIFRMIRGTGPDGLSGMGYIRRDDSGFLIIRPLLDTRRADIEAYCKTRGLAPRTDLSNGKLLYARNRIRLELLPYLREHFNPNVSEALNRFCEIAREDTAYLWEQTEEVWPGLVISSRDDECVLKRDLLNQLPPAIRHRALLKAFRGIGLWQDIAFVHLTSADRLIGGENASGYLNFPHGYSLQVSYQQVICSAHKTESLTPEQYLSAKILYREDYYEIPGSAVFDIDRLAQVYDFAGGPLSMITARTREPGDFITLEVGTKSIQDLMVDMKIPRHLRDGIYMAAIGNEILWIPEGVSKARYNSRYAVDDETKRVLILEMEKAL